METKICTKCGIEKSLSEFSKRPERKNGFRSDCKLCEYLRHKKYQQQHKELYYNSNKNWRTKNKKKLQQDREKIKKETPWILTWYRINSRCNTKTNPDYLLYGGRGIRNKLLKSDCKFLWFRDKAYLLQQASIHRKNSDGNYTISNCKYIEQTKNIGIANKENKSIKILQFTKEGLLIKKWKSINFASKSLKMTDTNICNALSGRSHTAGGFIWKYK
jgi:hypothetical protein